MRLMNSVATKVILVMGLILSSTSCSYEDPILKSFDEIDVIKMDGNKADIELNFTLENPNRQKIKLKSATFDISINKIFIGTATLLEPTELPGNGEYKVNMKMNIALEKSIGDLALSLAFAILTNDIQMQVKGNAKGSLGILGRTFPVNHTEKVNWDDLQRLSF